MAEDAKEIRECVSVERDVFSECADILRERWDADRVCPSDGEKLALSFGSDICDKELGIKLIEVIRGYVGELRGGG